MIATWHHSQVTTGDEVSKANCSASCVLGQDQQRMSGTSCPLELSLAVCASGHRFATSCSLHSHLLSEVVALAWPSLYIVRASTLPSMRRPWLQDTITLEALEAKVEELVSERDRLQEQLSALQGRHTKGPGSAEGLTGVEESSLVSPEDAADQPLAEMSELAALPRSIKATEGTLDASGNGGMSTQVAGLARESEVGAVSVELKMGPKDKGQAEQPSETGHAVRMVQLASPTSMTQAPGHVSADVADPNPSAAWTDEPLSRESLATALSGCYSILYLLL